MLITQPPSILNKLAAILAAMTVPWYVMHGQGEWAVAMVSLTAFNAVVGWK